MSQTEIVTVCKLNGQWGLWLPGCQEHVTQYHPSSLHRPLLLNSKQAVLDAVEHIRENWRADYGEDLPWRVEVIE